MEAADRDQPGYTQFLHDLLAAEVDAVEQRRLKGRLRFAKLPARKTIEQFDFTAQPSLDRRLVEDLATLRFIQEKANVIAIGPPGVGKTMLATALGHRAVEAGYRVYYTTAADLVARTSRAALEGRWATTMRFWNGPQLLIIDELGYLPMPAEAAAHLFQVISRRRPPTLQPKTRAAGAASPRPTGSPPQHPPRRRSQEPAQAAYSPGPTTHHATHSTRRFIGAPPVPMAPSRKALKAWRDAGSKPGERPRTFFKMTAVFDRSQVDVIPDFPGGATPLTPPTVALSGEDLADRWPALAELANSIGSTVTLETIIGGADGFYEIKTKRIVIDIRLPGNARVSTLVHELAHALVAADTRDDDPKLDYAQEEVVAETVAFSVCSGLGFDTSGESVPYIADYSTTAGVDVIQRHAGLIDRLAKRIEEAAEPISG